MAWPVPVVFFGVASALSLWRRETLAFCIAVSAGFFCLHTFNHHGDPAKRLAGELSSGPRVVSCLGIVRSEPRETVDRNGARFSRFLVRLETVRIGSSERGSRAFVKVSWPGAAPRYGDRVVFVGEGRNLTPVRNPGEYDLTEHLHRRGIYSEIRVRYESDTRVREGGHGNPLFLAGMRVRRWMEQALTTGIEDAPLVSGLVQSMVLGKKSGVPPEIRDLFRRTGTIHVFVVSGLHVGMVAFIVWQLLRLVGLGRRATAVFAVPFLAFYAVLAGSGPGSVRATIMASVVLLGIALERPPVTCNSLAAAFVLTLLWDTDQLFMPGFQLSFAVVLAILILAPRLQLRFRPLGEPDPFLPRDLWTPWQRARTVFLRYSVGLVAVSVSAWIGSLVFTAGYFHLMSPMALVANLLIVPLAFVILSQGVMSILAYSVSAGIASVFNNCNWLAVHLLVGTVRLFAALPGGYSYVELPQPGKRPQFEMTVLDLDSGSSIHVRANGRDWLLDCGNEYAYRTIVRPYLQTRGVNRLEGFVITHGDASHMGAAVEVLADFRPRRIMLPALSGSSPSLRMLRDEMHERDRMVVLIRRGDVLSLGAHTRARALFPPPDLVRRHADDESLVLRIESDVWSVLATGDSGFFTERWLMAREESLESDFLVSSRHRRDFSLTPDFLSRVRPRAVVLGRTHYTEARRRLPVMVGEVFDQEETGAVRIRFWRKAATVDTHLGSRNMTFRVERRLPQPDSDSLLLADRIEKARQ